jgi:starch synthase
MYSDLPGSETLRFQIQLPRADYRALVARLRGADSPRVLRGASHGCANTSQVTALIDLLPHTTTFSITRLGQHRLPRSVSIRPGSSTHILLTHTISQKLSSITDPVVALRLKAIVDACPAALPAPVRVHPNDFILNPQSLPTHRPPLGRPELSAAPPDVHIPDADIPDAASSVTNVRILATLAPTILFDLDDAPTLVITEPISQIAAELSETLSESIRSSLSHTLRIQAQVVENCVTLTGVVAIPTTYQSTAGQEPESLTTPPVALYAHWGSYDDLAKPWQDEQIALIEPASATVHSDTLTTECSATLNVPIHGSYGVSFYARIDNTQKLLWLGRPRVDDLTFTIAHDDPHTIASEFEARRTLRRQAATRAQTLLTTPKRARDIAWWFSTEAAHLSLGAVVAAQTRYSRAACEMLDTAIANLHATGDEALAQRLSTSYGVGELVFITPEGPHAAAGGLAHVITGLPHELTDRGVPVTIIAPLYRYANGNKHRSAEEVLRDGITLGSERVIPRYRASITVNLGPTHFRGTGFQKRPATSVPCTVYSAESGSLRLVLIANASAFDRLYQPVYADEQLRRAIIFSRAALETIATEALDIRPAALISNDWMTACVPSLVTLDPRYRDIPWLQQAKAIHMIHNGGADYHGRLPLHFGDEDLWPLFGLAPEHYFGFRDPHRDDLINLTMAAVQHCSGGVLTVSQPYARELVSQGGGDGLERVLEHKRHMVFGVSNGINRNDIEAFLQTCTKPSPHSFSEVDSILAAKAEVRHNMQRTLGLNIDPHAQIISFVGRLAEQKGLDLLSGLVDYTQHSMLEEILTHHPSVQVIIAGPVTNGDRSATALLDAARYLRHRYPGRIATLCEYISHSTALTIMTASTLFLMPSRFEPGGITQLEALAVGTPVVARSVGGIAATISNFDPITGTGTGFLCHDYSATAFANTVHWALAMCSDAPRYRSLVGQARTARHSWADRAPEFLAVVQSIILGSARTERDDIERDDVERDDVERDDIRRDAARDFEKNIRQLTFLDGAAEFVVRARA